MRIGTREKDQSNTVTSARKSVHHQQRRTRRVALAELPFGLLPLRLCRRSSLHHARAMTDTDASSKKLNNVATHACGHCYYYSVLVGYAWTSGRCARPLSTDADAAKVTSSQSEKRRFETPMHPHMAIMPGGWER